MADTQIRRCVRDGMRRPRREGQRRRLSARVADPVEAWSGKGFTRLLCPGERRQGHGALKSWRCQTWWIWGGARVSADGEPLRSSPRWSTTARRGHGGGKV
ncbi:uncharacterized protein M6B38_190020 [Iris pallida]|uniref:Uncharacterized protein n=1 Tax=Iris pallida TaxID=29817 RepID=A0AAX6EFS5_IRIPA|nr:uncharacterized protein M6B38_190020 [Iris pallida]